MEINHYFMAITEANTELRGASLAPEFVGGEVGETSFSKETSKSTRRGSVDSEEDAGSSPDAGTNIQLKILNIGPLSNKIIIVVVER